jgi:glutaredoxin
MLSSLWSKRKALMQPVNHAEKVKKRSVGGVSVRMPGQFAVRIPGRVLTTCLLLLSVSLPGFAQMYRWKDQDGNLVISTNPPPPGVKWEAKTTGLPSPEAPKIMENGPIKRGTQEVTLTRANRDIKVTMYMTTWCPVCKKARDYLKSLGVNLLEYDIEKDPDRKKEWSRMSGDSRGVPAIDIEGIVLLGLNSRSIDKAIEERSRIGAQY